MRSPPSWPDCPKQCNSAFLNNETSLSDSCWMSTLILAIFADDL